jgi:hypothetical protein
VIGKSEDGIWWVVRLNPENVGAGYGWIEAAYTQATNVENIQTIENPDTYQTEPPPPPPDTSGPIATSVDYINIRSGPGTNYPVVVVAPPGSTGVVTGKSSDGLWWQVKISTTYSADGFGWVSADWVYTQNTSNVPVVSAPPAPPPLETTPPPPPATTGCLLVSQTPADGTTYNVGIPFNTTWVLKNAGNTNWDPANVDFVYVGAANNIPLHTGSDIYDLSTAVSPGATYNFTVQMIAPFNMGTYGEMWQISQDNQIVCQFYVYITVP